MTLLINAGNDLSATKLVGNDKSRVTIGPLVKHYLYHVLLPLGSCVDLHMVFEGRKSL